MIGLPSVFGLKGMAIAAVIGAAVGGFAAYKVTNAFGEAAVLRLEKADQDRTIADQAATIGAFQKAAADAAALDLAERQRAKFAQTSIDALQKEADDAAAVSAANAAHRPDVCDLTPAEFDWMRRRLP